MAVNNKTINDQMRSLRGTTITSEIDDVSSRFSSWVNSQRMRGRYVEADEIDEEEEEEAKSKGSANAGAHGKRLPPTEAERNAEINEKIRRKGR